MHEIADYLKNLGDEANKRIDDDILFSEKHELRGRANALWESSEYVRGMASRIQGRNNKSNRISK